MGYLTPTNSFSKYKGYIPYQNKLHKIPVVKYTLPKSFYLPYGREKYLIYKTRERLFNSTVDRRVGIIPYMLESKYYTCSNCKEFGYS